MPYLMKAIALLLIFFHYVGPWLLGVCAFMFIFGGVGYWMLDANQVGPTVARICARRCANWIMIGFMGMVFIGLCLSFGVGAHVCQ